MVHLPKLGIGDVHVGEQLFVQLGAWDFLPIAGFQGEHEIRLNVRGQEALILLEVERAVRLKLRSPYDFRGRREPCGGNDLIVGNTDAAALVFLLEQQSLNEFLEDGILERPLLLQ